LYRGKKKYKGDSKMSRVNAKIMESTDHTYGNLTRQKAWSTPLVITDAEGAYFYSDTGKRYLDFSSQLICSNLGHKNKAVLEAIIKQAEKMAYCAPGFPSEARAPRKPLTV
jgi:taurine--2-oxoglutarate transaminase